MGFARFSTWFGQAKIWTAVAAFASAAWGQGTLELHVERSSPYDLEISGRLEGLPAGGSRYLRWQALRALPVTRLKVEGEFVSGEQEVTVVFLEDLLRRLPLEPGVDTVLATCTDRYASVYTAKFMKQYRPFLVLEINGDGPERWPPPGLNYNPGPYVISVSDTVAPGVSSILDIGHKRPWGTAALELAVYAERFRTAYEGRWSTLSAAAVQGREVWINSCSSCHQGPDGLWGGNKSERPFAVLEALAGYNAAYFKTYVRTPQAINPSAKMEPHPHYTDEQLDALIAFVTADGRK